MKRSAPRVRASLFLTLLCVAWHQGHSREKPQEKPKDVAERKNPVKPTPENLAEAKKFFGYDCAMCHGASGDGKGDLAPSMGLKMIDWRDTSTVADMSDGEMFDLIVKGRGKMEGEGGRIKEDLAWKLVNYARTLAKKESAPPSKLCGAVSENGVILRPFKAPSQGKKNAADLFMGSPFASSPDTSGTQAQRLEAAFRPGSRGVEFRSL